MFITFEGIDGSGKTTQSILLKQYLEKKGYDIVLTREPGGTVFGDKIRKLVLNTNEKFDFFTEIYLYSAIRNEHFAKIIKPALKKNKIVICDRFYDSTIAYQGYGRSLGAKEVILLNKHFIKNCKPDITFFIDTPIEIIKKRFENKKLDRIEKEGILFMDKVRKGYLSIIKKEPKRFFVINGKEKKENNIKNIIKYLMEKFSL